MAASLIFAIPLAITWMLVTGHVSLDSLFVGLLIGAAIALLVRSEEPSVSWRTLPDQTVALLIYTLTLCRDIWLSSVDVAKRVLNPALPMNPGVLAVDTQDETEDDAIAAFSAHGITITPGELVLDFDGSRTMYVHCLDIGNSSQSAPGAQTVRLRRLRRVFGQSAPAESPMPETAPEGAR